MKNKILTISIILILLSFIFINNNVFAASYDLSDYKNYISGKNWMIYYNLSTESICLITTSNTYIYTNGLKLQEDGNYLIGDGIITSNNLTTNPWGAPGSFNIYVFDKNNSTFSYYKNVPSSEYFRIDHAYLIASNCTVYFAQDHSNFFQPTPVPSKVIIGQTTLSEELEEIMKTAGEQATLEMGQIILIVIMTTAGLMVLLIGLKKGLTVLMNGFRH